MIKWDVTSPSVPDSTFDKPSRPDFLVDVKEEGAVARAIAPSSRERMVEAALAGKTQKFRDVIH